MRMRELCHEVIQAAADGREMVLSKEDVAWLALAADAYLATMMRVDVTDDP